MRNRVSSTVSQLRLHSMHAFVYVDHERMEVHASLLGNMWGQSVVEEVHEHRLAGPDISKKVQALQSLIRGEDGGFGELASK